MNFRIYGELAKPSRKRMTDRFYLNMMTVVSQAKHLADANPDIALTIAHLEQAICTQAPTSQVCADWVKSKESTK